MLAEFVTVVPQTPLAGAHHLPSRISGRVVACTRRQTISLAPLNSAGDRGADRRTAGFPTRRWPAGRADRGAGRREPVLRRGDHPRPGRARHSRRRPRAPTYAATTAPPSAFRAHCRPPSPHASIAWGRRQNTRYMPGPSSARDSSQSARHGVGRQRISANRPCRALGGRTDRSGDVHPARRIRVSAPAYPHRGLRVAAQGRACTVASARCHWLSNNAIPRVTRTPP